MHYFDKIYASNRSVWRVLFQIFFTSKGAHPPQTPPFEAKLYPSNREKYKTIGKKENEQEVHLFSLKKATNQQNCSI